VLGEVGVVLSNGSIGLGDREGLKVLSEGFVVLVSSLHFEPTMAGMRSITHL
jgi:hypothetical protein